MTTIDLKIRRFICFCIFNLMMSATICNAYSLGPWEGTFPEGVPSNSAEYPPFSITTDSLVTLNVVAALTLDSQFAFIEINDSAGNRVAYNLLMDLPVTFKKPLAPGEFSVKIVTSLGTVYGDYSITGTVEPTNITTTESEINDTTATPTLISGDGFGGSLGHWWDQDDVDTVDYFTYTVLKDGTLKIDTIIDSTLKSYSAGLSVRGAENQNMFSSYFSEESFSTTAYLTPGTYFMKASIGLNNLWGAYSSTLTFTPAVENSSEIENNDTMATATPVTTKVFYGSYGYLRPEGSGDYTDYFSMDVQSPGNVTLKVTIDDTLKGYYTAVHLYDSAGKTVTYKTLSKNEVTISEEGLAPGQYYLRFSQSLHSYRGGYKVESDGLNLPDPPDPKININDIAISGTREVGSPVTFRMNTQNSLSSSINYRYSLHPDYGTSGYDGLHWSSMTSTEYTTQNSIGYTFNKAGKYIVVVWAKNDISDSNTDVEIIGSSIDIKEKGGIDDTCKIDISGISLSGKREVGSPVTFTLDASNSCSDTVNYRFSYHGGYGTDAYDGLNWKSMTGTEYTTDNSIAFTFENAGKYIVVVWAKNGISDSNTGVELIGISVDIDEKGEEPYFPF